MAQVIEVPDAVFLKVRAAVPCWSLKEPSTTAMVVPFAIPVAISSVASQLEQKDLYQVLGTDSSGLIVALAFPDTYSCPLSSIHAIARSADGGGAVSVDGQGSH